MSCVFKSFEHVYPFEKKPVNMRLVWKRNLIGNLLVLFFFASLLVGYIFLLRYNKASASHFNLVPRHKKIRGLAVFTLDSKKRSNSGLKHVNTKRKVHPSSSALDVFVVEEHHQVIPIWLNAVKSGKIAQHGNTLVHIDGHSDAAVPHFVPGYPFFRFPRDSHEMNRMIQRNDVFIMQAVMAGLIKRFIWIWPKWDQENHDKDYELFKSQLGWAHIKTGDLKEKAFCLCRVNSSNHKECEFAPNLHSGIEYKDLEIPTQMCNIKKEITVEYVREDVALKKLKKEKWLQENEKIMLDIDEDYYGCTYASQPLLDVGVKLSMLLQINNILPQLFCPKSIYEERTTDKLLFKGLDVFLTPVSCNASGDKHPKHGSKLKQVKCSKERHKNQVLHQIKNFLWNEQNSVSCGKKTRESENLLMQLVELFFSHLNPKQIKVLQKVGFCLSTTLNSYLPISQPEFRICMGNNNPEESSVLIHKPTGNEIVKRTKLLNEMISLLRGYRKPLVTVCRSVRDGYTPRRYFRQIEHDILKSLNNSFKPLKFRYDFWLLGGKYGWTVRNR